MNKTYVKSMALCAFCTALICIGAIISVPFPVPFTMQSFGVFFALLILGGKRGTLSILLYILLGVIGLPVFSGFGSGIGAIAGYSGGFIVGFLAIGVIYTLLTSLLGDSNLIRVFALTVGQLCCYALGALWFVYVHLSDGGAVAWIYALSTTVLPFIIPDALKFFLAVVFARRLERVVKL